MAPGRRPGIGDLTRGNAGVNEMILLMGHGSRDPDGVRELLALIEAVRRAAPPGLVVEAGVLEFAGPEIPSIQEAIERCVESGARQIRAVPLLLLNAAHARHDLPAQLAHARERYPDLDLQMAPPLGLHRWLLEIVEERLAELEARLPPLDPRDTALLLVGRGTSDPEANADLFKLGRVLWERHRYALVECCFAGTAEPLVPAGINRCVRLGARQILVLPYLINTGILVKRIHLQAAAARTRHPGVEIAVGAHLGVHPGLVQLILQRAQQVGPIGLAADDLQLGRGWRYGPANNHHLGMAHHHHLPPRSSAEQTGLDGGPGTVDGASQLSPVSANPLRDPLADEVLRSRSPDGQPTARPWIQPAPADPSSRPTLVDRYVLPPEEIERRSLQQVAEALGPDSCCSEAERQVIQRLVYAAGDVSLAPLIRCHPEAVSAGVAALRAGQPIVVDVRMVEAGLDHARVRRLGCPVHCAIDDEAVARQARDQGLPCAVLAMRALAPRAHRGVVVIGNAPTALLALLDLIDAGEVQPALIVATPVGFVAAAASKAELIARRTPYITIEGTRGGSALAAAAINALLRLAVAPD